MQSNYLEKYKHWLKSVNKEEKKELEKIKDNDKEIRERFELELNFGTAGMRGTIALGTFNMNNYTVMRASQGLAEYIKESGQEAMKRGVVISYDVRRCSYEFALITARVLAYHNINVYLFENVRPVPMCSFAVRNISAFAGVMITASHNPKEYNGYKVYGEDGAQLDLDATNIVVSYINKITDPFSVKLKDINLKDRNEILNKSNYKIDDYITIIGKEIDEKFYNEVEKQILSKDAVKNVANNFKIIYTPIHGTGAIPVTDMFNRMGLSYQVVKEQFLPDSEFLTVEVPNPEFNETLNMGIELAKKNLADVVIGTDPDCDRMGIAIKNNEGKFITINGNEIGALLLYYEIDRRKELNILKNNSAIVKTIVTTKLADKIADKNNIKTFNVLTGFKFIGEKIKEWEQNKKYTFLFGYEESYGYLAGTHARDKDAVVASALFADMTCYYKDKGISIYDLLIKIKEEFGFFVEKSISITFKGLNGMQKMKEIMSKLLKDKKEKIANYDVISIEDLKNSLIYNIKTKEESKIDLPSSNVIKYNFDKYEWAAVRPSGTEPKLKIYVSVCEKNNEDSNKKADLIIQSIKDMLN